MKPYNRLLKYLDLYRTLILYLALNLPIMILLLLRNLHRVDLSLLTGVYLFCVTLGYYGLALLIIVTLIVFSGYKWPKMVTGSTAAVFVIFHILPTYRWTDLQFNINTP